MPPSLPTQTLPWPNATACWSGCVVFGQLSGSITQHGLPKFQYGPIDIAAVDPLRRHAAPCAGVTEVLRHVEAVVVRVAAAPCDARDHDPAVRSGLDLDVVRVPEAVGAGGVGLQDRLPRGPDVRT